MLNFSILLLKKHYSSYFDKSVLVGVIRIIVEIIVAFFVFRMMNNSIKPIDSSTIGSILTSISLFSSVLIAILVLLHGQLSKYSFQHDVKIDQSQNQEIPKEMKIGFKRNMLIAKIRTTQYLFGNISFCLVVSILMTILLSFSIVIEGYPKTSRFMYSAGIFLLTLIFFVIIEIIRRLFYLLDDDFEELTKPIK